MLSLAALGVAPPSRALGAADQDRAIAELMLEHDPALHLARNVLPARVSQDAGALYSWCRRLDQIVDSGRPRDQVSRELDSFEAAFDALVAGDPRDPADAALLSTLQRHPSLGRQPFDDMLNSGFHATAKFDRTGSCCRVAQTFLHHGLRQHGRCGGAISGFVFGLGRHLLDQFGADVFEGILELDLLLEECNATGFLEGKKGGVEGTQRSLKSRETRCEELRSGM